MREALYDLRLWLLAVAGIIPGLHSGVQRRSRGKIFTLFEMADAGNPPAAYHRYHPPSNDQDIPMNELEIYIIGVVPFAFYWIADFTKRGPLNRALDRYYGRFGKWALVMTAIILWPATVVILAVGLPALLYIGALIDPDVKVLAWLVITMVWGGCIAVIAS